MSHSGFKKTILVVHLWLGLISGLVVFILSITGAIYTFQDELKKVFYQDRLYINPAAGASRLPLSTLLPIAERALGKEHKITRAELSQDPSRTYMFRAMKVNKESTTYLDYYTYYYKVYLNPYTGEVVFLEDTTKEFFTVVLALHMNLLLGDHWGHLIVTWSVVIFVVLLLTGMVLWWPDRIRKIRQSITIKWDARFKRLNYDLHNVLGAYSFVVLLVVALTGLMWSFELTTDTATPVTSDTTMVEKVLPADKILNQALDSNPRTAYFLYNFPSTTKGTVNVSAYQDSDRLYTRVQNKYDRYTGELLQAGKTFDDQTLKQKVITLNYDLHVGSVFGMTGKILAFIACLIAASLPITGFLIWWKKK